MFCKYLVVDVPIHYPMSHVIFQLTTLPTTLATTFPTTFPAQRNLLYITLLTQISLLHASFLSSLLSGVSYSPPSELFFQHLGLKEG